MFLIVLKWVLLALSIISLIIGVIGLLEYEDYSIVAIAITVILVIGFFVVRHYTNKTTTKGEHNKKQDIVKISKSDIALQDYLVSTSEPKYFIIAPMSYDTSKFEQVNSRGKKDHSVERLILLEEAISKFENYIDDMTGFSFIDRSKIAQIEKEHKFQLSDWSNDTKTAEIGRALNANVLLFLDKFNFLDQNGGEYRFEAKFVDINTMQTTTYLLVYSGKKLKEPTETLERINFRNFTQISSHENPFVEDLNFSVVKVFKTVQDSKLTFGRNLKACPLGFLEKHELNTDEMDNSKYKISNFTSINFEGPNSITLVNNGIKIQGTYVFEPSEQFVEKIGFNYFTDGCIGKLSITSSGLYESYDVFTQNNREYYLKLNSAETEKITVNYYLQMVRQ